MEIFVLVLLLFTSRVTGFCPNGCGCDDEKLETTCLYTNLEVMPITLNPDVRSLVLKYNKFKTVDASISFYPSLVNLDISSNKLEVLHDKVFVAQHILEELNLSDNNISEISQRTFVGLRSLTRLNIRKNDIEFLNEGCFFLLQSLQILDLSENQISSVNSKAFINLEKLQVLNLRNNYLTSVPSESFSSLINLVELNLSGNTISVISSLALQSLSSLVSLNLARNNLEKIDEEGLHGLNSVTDLYLEDNDFNKLPTKALSKVINLDKLVLGQNPFQIISHNALIGNINLKAINISHCPQLTEIESGAFKDNILLRTIVISDNANLHTIASDAFDDGTEVESLDLRRNCLNSLSEDLIDWKYVKNLQLSENLWQCDCDLKWLQKTIFNIVNNTQASVRIVKCFYPNFLWDRDVVSANIEDCDNASRSAKLNNTPEEFDEAHIVFIVTLVFASFVVVVVIFSAVVCICLRCRQRSSERSSCNASDTSRGTDVSYYQVGRHVYASPVIHAKNVQNLPQQYLLAPWDESDKLCQEEEFHRTLKPDKYFRYPL